MGVRKSALLCLLFSALPAFASNHTVGAADPRIQYSGNKDWIDQDNGGHRVSSSNAASASFTFSGSAIYFLSAKNWNGASAAISVDGQDSVTVDQAKGTKKDDPIIPSFVLYSQKDLSGGPNHTIQVSWAGLGALGGGYLEIFGFIYDDAPGNTTTSAASSSSPTSSPAESSTTSISTNNSNAAVIGGAVGGAIGGLLVGGLLVFCLFRLRRRPSATADSKRAEAHSHDSRPNVGRTGTDIEEDKPEAPASASAPGSSRIQHGGIESSGSNDLANSVTLPTLSGATSSSPRRSTSDAPQVHTSSASIDTTASPIPVPSARHGYGVGLQVQATSPMAPASPERGQGPGKIAATARARILAGQSVEEMSSMPQPETLAPSVTTAVSPPVRALPIPESTGTRPESDIAPPVYTERPS